MRCIAPGEVTPEELLAYAHGEAPSRVVEHVRGCMHCAAEAGDYAWEQWRLASRLHRVTCPSPHALGEYELAVLSPEERTRVAAHARDCRRCADELHQLREFLADEPRVAGARLGLGIRRIIAALVAPPAWPALAGYAAVRSAGSAPPRTYRAEDVTFAISVGSASPGTGGRASLAGLIGREGTALETIGGATVTLTAEDGAALTAEVDDFGGFAFDELPPGTHRLEVLLGDRLVTIEALSIDG